MRRTLISALITATLLAPAAQAEVEPYFADDFTERLEIPISSWMPFGLHAEAPVEGMEGYFVGANQVNVDGGAMLFEYFSSQDPLFTFYNEASVVREIYIGGPPTVRFSFTPGDAAFDFVFGFGGPGGSYCDANLNESLVSGAPAVIPCSTPFAVRIISQSGGGPTKPVAKSGGAAGPVHRAPVAPSADFAMVLGSIDAGMFGGYAGDLAGFPIVAGVTYQIDYTVAEGESGPIVMLTVSDGENSRTIASEPLSGGDRKPGRQRIFAPEAPSEGFPLFVVDAGRYNLSSLDGSGLRTSAVHSFDDFLVIPSVGIPVPEPEYTITAEVEAKGKFKKQPIDIRKKGVLQATVYGDNSGDDALDVESIRLDTVTFGATGGESPTPALGVRYAQVDKDGVLDAIFDFAKSAAVTPCGTTSVTITGDFDVEGGFARFSGADNRVKVTGCPRAKRSD